MDVADESNAPPDRPQSTDAVIPPLVGGTGEPTSSPTPGVFRYRVRRAPNIWAFLVTGAFLGAIVGSVVDYFGPDGCPTTTTTTTATTTTTTAMGAACTAPYSPGVSLAYFLALGALAGIAVAATVVVVVEGYLAKR